MDELSKQLTILKQVIVDAGPYVVLVFLAFFYMRHQRQREHEQNAVSIVQAETQNAAAANTASLIQITDKLNRAFTDLSERQEKQTERMIAALQDVANSNVARTKAIEKSDATLVSFSERFASEITGMKTAINAAGEQMTASRAATDNRLDVIQAGVEHTGQAVAETKAVIETLPADTTKVVLELGDKALSDHTRIQMTVDAIAKRLDDMPAYVAQAITPLVDELRREIKAIATLTPVREVALGALPLNERTAGQLAADALRAELGKAEGAA